MLQFSTDDLRPQDRFDHWCEVRGRSMFGVTIELPAEKRAGFRGRFSAVAVGGAVASHMQASSYRVSRTNADIARMAGHSLVIGLQVRGPGRMDVGKHTGHRVGEGAFVINHLDLPYAAIPDGDGGFDFRALKISLTGDLLLGASAHDLIAGTPRPDERFMRPFASLFDALSRRPSELVDPHRDVAHIARLALLLRGRLAPGMPEVRAALRAGVLQAARDIMVRDLHLPALSPDTVAAELSISLRHLHALFEPTGRTFSRTLTAKRLTEVCRLLLADTGRPVTQIAYACGFDSVATFYRVFRSLIGMTPGDWRELHRAA